MGNNGSFMEKVYVYLPVLMCHSKMDYGNRVTMRNIRLGYFIEQASNVACCCVRSFQLVPSTQRHQYTQCPWFSQTVRQRKPKQPQVIKVKTSEMLQVAYRV